MNPLHRRTKLERSDLETLLAHELERDPRVVFAYLFGSFLEDRPFHDVDIAVQLSMEDTGEQLAHSLTIAGDLSRLIQLPVEVHALNEAPTSFAFHAMQGHLLTCRDEDLLTHRLESTMRRYFDLQPLLRRSLQEIYEP